MEIFNPLKTPLWDKLLEATDGASFFHTSSWARVLQESYQYEPVYFARIEKEKFTDLIPLMQINSVLTGKRGVSLPFTDFCPLISKKKTFLTTSTPSSSTGRNTAGSTLNFVTLVFFLKKFLPSAFITNTN